MSDSIVEILSEKAAKTPDRLFAADSSGTKYTYGSAWKKVRAIAARFRKAGIGESDFVMTECNQRVEYLLIDMACQLTGAIFTPVEAGASMDRKLAIADETGCALWIYASAPLEDVKSAAYDDVCSEDDVAESDWKFPEKSAVAQILYTTGTTGKSKGVVITNGANVALAQNIREGVQMRNDNVEFIPVPISHSHGLRCCYANILNGGTIILSDGLMDIKNVFRMLEEYSVSAMDVSPNAMKMLIKLSKGAFWAYAEKMRYIQIGTASLPEELKTQLQENLNGVHLYNFYGSTESGRSCVLDFSVVRDKKNCIGKATKNSTIIFTDENRVPVKTDADNPGLLATSGPMNMSGYWKNPELTDEIMKDGFVYTADLGYIDDEGYVYVLGRNDDVINYNGIKIAPEEIEDVAVKYDGVLDAACVAASDARSGQVPKLFIVVADENTFDLKSYNRYLAEHIDANKSVKQIEFISEIPRTYNGKIQRKKLRS